VPFPVHVDTTRATALAFCACSLPFAIAPGVALKSRLTRCDQISISCALAVTCACLLTFGLFYRRGVGICICAWECRYFRWQRHSIIAALFANSSSDSLPSTEQGGPKGLSRPAPNSLESGRTLLLPPSLSLVPSPSLSQPMWLLSSLALSFALLFHLLFF